MGHWYIFYNINKFEYWRVLLVLLCIFWSKNFVLAGLHKVFMFFFHILLFFSFLFSYIYLIMQKNESFFGSQISIPGINSLIFFFILCFFFVFWNKPLFVLRVYLQQP